MGVWAVDVACSAFLCCWCRGEFFSCLVRVFSVFFIIFAENLYTMKRKEYIGVVAAGSKKCSVANIAPFCLAGKYFFI